MTDIEAADAYADSMQSEPIEQIDPVENGSLEGDSDAATGQPPQAALRFMEIWHRFDAQDWPPFLESYLAAFNARRNAMRRAA